MKTFKVLAVLMGLGLGTLVAQQQAQLSAFVPPPVGNVQVGVVGTAGTATSCYWIVVNYVGGSVMAPRGACLTNVPNTLDSNNYVQITWTAASGTGITYDVLKTTSNVSPSPGVASSLYTAQTVTTKNDQGGSLSAYTAASYTYQNVSAVVSLNNRDYALPQVEVLGYPLTITAQGGQGATIAVKRINDLNGTAVLVPDGAGNTAINTNFNLDSTGAALNVVYSVESNISIANVNTGVTLVAATTGRTLKVVGISLEALGGAVGTCTAVVIADTASSPVTVASVAIAALTQSKAVLESSANVTVGTMNLALTAGKGITVGKTGGTCDTATSVLVRVLYKINS